MFKGLKRRLGLISSSDAESMETDDMDLLGSHRGRAARLDPKLGRVLKDLKLYREYRRGFRLERVIYNDLGRLRMVVLKRLIPEEVPRDRFCDYIRTQFGNDPREARDEDSGSEDEPLPVAPVEPESDAPSAVAVGPASEKKTAAKWEIDPSLIRFRDKKKTSTVGSGNFGSISVGRARIGIGWIDVAVKTVVLDGEQMTKKAVVGEVLAMNELDHPNVLPCFGCYFSEDERAAYIVLEFCPNGDLTGFRNRHPHLRPLRKLDFLLQIARGMEYIHRKGFIHRDLKLCNVLVGNDQKSIKICDFGTCRKRKKLHGTLCGTPSYISPEQFYGRKMTDPRTIDVYAFGILAWTFWCGVMPYSHIEDDHSESAYALLHAIHDDRTPARPPLDHRRFDDCPAEVRQLVASCWAAKEQDRPTGFRAIRKRLQAALESLQALVRAARRRKAAGDGT